MTTIPVRLKNHGSAPFSGWVRTKVDALPPSPHGVLADGTKFVLGLQDGQDTWSVDLEVTLQPHEERIVDLANPAGPGQPFAFSPAPVPADYGTLSMSGGTSFVLGEGGAFPDGAMFRGRFVTRTADLFLVELDLWYYADEPGVVWGECTILASNPNVPTVTAQISASTSGIRWGSSWVFVLGHTPQSYLVPIGTNFADGQARTFPICFVWPTKISAERVASVFAKANFQVSAVGIQKLWHTGNPIQFPGFNAADWTRQQSQLAIQALHTWFVDPGVGPANLSGETGYQEAFLIRRGEPLLPNGLGSEWALYLATLGSAWCKNWPCHYREANGRLVDPAMHPHWVVWSGRTHYNENVSPDRLGKSQDLTPEMTPSEALGPEPEHWPCDIAATARLVWSPALQRNLQQQAMLFLASQTIPSMLPNWSTNGPNTSRAMGYACCLAVELYRNLADRALAERVRQRLIARWNEVYRPLFWNTTGPLTVFVNDGRLWEDGSGCLPWQESLAAYGFWLAGTVFGVQDMVTLGVRLARWCVDNAWHQSADVPAVWHSYSAVEIGGQHRADPSTIFDFYASPLAPAVLVLAEPENARARSILTQLVSSVSQYEQMGWFDPAAAAAVRP